jgi:hypothetical protein
MRFGWALVPAVVLATHCAIAAGFGRELSAQDYVDLAGVLVAGLALSTRSLTAHVLGRGVLWFVMARAGLWLFDRSASGAFSGEALFVVAAAAAAWVALCGTRSALDAPWARAAFAPVAYRPVLLAAAIACTGLGATMLLMAGLSIRALTPFLSGFNLMGAALLVAGLGIARMRAWGVVLAAACAVAALIIFLAMTDPATAFGVMPTLPGMWASPPRWLAGALPLAPLPIGALPIATVLLARRRLSAAPRSGMPMSRRPSPRETGRAA